MEHRLHDPTEDVPDRALPMIRAVERAVTLGPGAFRPGRPNDRRPVLRQLTRSSLSLTGVPRWPVRAHSDTGAAWSAPAPVRAI